MSSNYLILSVLIQMVGYWAEFISCEPQHVTIQTHPILSHKHVTYHLHTQHVCFLFFCLWQYSPLIQYNITSACSGTASYSL